MEVKIFEFETEGGKVWIASCTEEKAKEYYEKDIKELYDDEEAKHNMTELPRDEWSKRNVKNDEYDETDPEDWHTATFEEVVLNHFGLKLFEAGFAELIAQNYDV